ncbi:hypothetical protein A2U01_0068431, partial [Trifolium medium]|nr:hypothetical protein [Trifolium medium]
PCELAEDWDKREWSIKAVDKETKFADKEIEATDVVETGNDVYHDHCFYPCDDWYQCLCGC